MTSAHCRWVWFVMLAIALVVANTHVSAQVAMAPRRVAVIVGANAALPGRRELRFALEDARRVAEALRHVGGFAASDVHVLLEPRPEVVLSLLDRVSTELAASEASLVLFYYSGHSDGQDLHPAGKPLHLADVREHLLRITARVRLGILDTCRGGSWTQAKDFSIGPPLPAADIAALSSEGNVLVAASSGFEAAHEAEVLRGSFFSHHLTAGMLGAADRSGDGDVSLQEAFEYARERTVRDSARYAPVPQHPSFEIELRGRQDIVLTHIRDSDSALDLVQARGPLEILQLASGVTVAELPLGTRKVRLALAPGTYLVRRVNQGRVYSTETQVNKGAIATVSEQQLELAPSAALAMKGGEAQPMPRSFFTSPSKHWFEWSLAIGVATGPTSQTVVNGYTGDVQSEPELHRTLGLSASLNFGITDRLTWALPLPAFSYRFGEPQAFEVVARMGLVGIRYDANTGMVFWGDAGVGARWWIAPTQSLAAIVAISTSVSVPTSRYDPASRNSLAVSGTLGYSVNIHHVVSLHPGIGFRDRVHVSDQPPSSEARPGRKFLALGSVTMLEYRELPLVQVHLSPVFSLDAHASWVIDVDDGDVYDSYLAGFTWDF